MTQGKPIEVIVAMDQNQGIGKDGRIPWQIPNGYEPTKQNAVIVGRKTWLSLPDAVRSIPTRVNVVLTTAVTDRVDNTMFAGAYGVGNLHNAIQFCEYHPDVEKIYIMGGASVYRASLLLADRVHITLIRARFDCDVFFPTLHDHLAVEYVGDPLEYNGVPFTQLTFKQRCLTW